MRRNQILLHVAAILLLVLLQLKTHAKLIIYSLFSMARQQRNICFQKQGAIIRVYLRRYYGLVYCYTIYAYFHMTFTSPKYSMPYII
jgi:hypothetical protein